jgi:hypothetical protein
MRGPSWLLKTPLAGQMGPQRLRPKTTVAHSRQRDRRQATTTTLQSRTGWSTLVPNRFDHPGQDQSSASVEKNSSSPFPQRVLTFFNAGLLFICASSTSITWRKLLRSHSLRRSKAVLGEAARTTRPQGNARAACNCVTHHPRSCFRGRRPVSGGMLYAPKIVIVALVFLQVIANDSECVCHRDDGSFLAASCR